jgi:hypothetical protein
MELTPIQKLKEDIKDLDITLYFRLMTLLVEAEEQERLFLERVFNDGLSTTEFEDYYGKFSKTK